MKSDYLVTPDGITLKTFHFESVQVKEKGTLFLTHSQAQHSENLFETATGLSQKGWIVKMADLRGHGQSTGPRAPLGHMEMNSGWGRLVSDLRLALEDAFKDVAWEKRTIVAPNIGSSLVLEILKDWPDLAQNIIFTSPPPNQNKLMKLGQAFTKARSIIHKQDKPDELTQTQLYRFLGLQLGGKDRLIDVMTSDRAITDKLLLDPYSWPTPTTGYFHEMFRGIESAWSWQANKKVKSGTRNLILYGSDDPVTAKGAFLGPIIDQMLDIGFKTIDSICIESGRAGLIIDENRFNISEKITRWISDDKSLSVGDKSLCQPLKAETKHVLGQLSYQVLLEHGLGNGQSIRSEDLLELCYNGVSDDRNWAEMMYRLAHEISTSTEFGDSELDRLVEQLMPHMERSYSLSRKVLEGAIIGSVLQEVINRFRLGMAVVDKSGKMLYSNELFEGALKHIFQSNPDENYKELAKILNNAKLTSSDELLLMRNNIPFGFYFRPHVLRQMGDKDGGRTGVIVIQNPQLSSEQDYYMDGIELLRLSYGLTQKEAEAAITILSGQSQEKAAGSMGMSINTLKTHLKSVFIKTGVRSQAELSSKLLKGPISLLIPSQVN